MCKIAKQQGFTVQHRNYNQYLIITYKGDNLEIIHFHITESLYYIPEPNKIL